MGSPFPTGEEQPPTGCPRGLRSAGFWQRGGCSRHLCIQFAYLTTYGKKDDCLDSPAYWKYNLRRGPNRQRPPTLAGVFLFLYVVVYRLRHFALHTKSPGLSPRTFACQETRFIRHAVSWPLLCFSLSHEKVFINPSYYRFLRFNSSICSGVR